MCEQREVGNFKYPIFVMKQDLLLVRIKINVLQNASKMLIK